MTASQFIRALFEGSLRSQGGPGARPTGQNPIEPVQVTAASGTPWYRQLWFHLILLLIFPYVQVPLMWFQKALSKRLRVVLTGVGVLLTVFYLSSQSANAPNSSSLSAGSAEPAGDGVRVTGPTGMTADTSDSTGEKLKGLTVEQAREYGRLSSHALSKLGRRNSLNSLDSLNELKRMKGERELTKDDIERMNFAMPMVPESRSIISEEGAKAGVSVDVRNAFFDGWDTGVSEVRRGVPP